MTHDITFLEKVYERLHQAGLVESKVEFSTRMLGKGPSYLTSMSARDRNVPEEVVAYLCERIASDINDIDITAAELEEELRRHKLKQAHRRNIVDWIAQHPEPAKGRNDADNTRENMLRRLFGRFHLMSRALPE